MLWTYKAQIRVEGWEKEVRKCATIQTVSRTPITYCALDYGSIDRVELKAGGTHLGITAITVLFKRDSVARFFDGPTD
jgi:hypothetical protein